MKTTCPTSLCDAREVIGRTTDNCGTYRGCEACLADLDCLFNTRTNQCVLGEDAPPLREYVWSCPARTVIGRTTDNCGTYRGCEACLADLDCLFNTRTNQCVLGADAPPLREYVWS